MIAWDLIAFFASNLISKGRSSISHLATRQWGVADDCNGVVREVMCNLLGGHINPIYKLLIVRISLLQWDQDFRNIIYWALNFEGLSFFFPLDRKYYADNLPCGCNVKQQSLFADWGSKHRLGGEQSFELCKCCISFQSPPELVRLLHQSVKGQRLFTETRNEST